MKWFIVVLMAGIFEDGSRDTYVYFKPQFESFEHCQTYVTEWYPAIHSQMTLEFQGNDIETVYCFRQDKLKDFLEINTKGKGINA